MNLTWDQVVKLSGVLCAKLTATLGPEHLRMCILHAVPRGGLPIATIMCHLLDLDRSHIQLSGGDKSIGAYICLVDEIADTGVSLKLEKDYVITQLASRLVDSYDARNRVVSATLVTRFNCNPRPDITALVYPGSEWLVFPWEVGSTQKEKEDARCENNSPND